LETGRQTKKEPAMTIRWSVLIGAGVVMISAAVATAQYPGPNRGLTIEGTPRPDFPGAKQSETSPSPRLSQSDMKTLTDARIDMLKGALRLTPEQTKYWPAVEDAIRERAQARYQRMTTIAATVDQIAQGKEVDPIELLRNRSDALTQRAANLKKFVDAWQPLYQTLSTDQKERARVVAGLVVRQMRNRIERQIDTSDDEGDEG
jgi:hypothetical protein